MSNWTFLKNSAWNPLKISRVGEGGENAFIRWHQYMSSIQVTDLTFAGKRGKKVEKFALYDIDYAKHDVEKHVAINNFVKLLENRNTTYKKAKDAAMVIANNTAPKIEVFTERGVDVTPAGFAPFKLETKNVSIEAGWRSFTINDKVDTNNLPSCIPAIDGGKKSIKVFYRWVQDNQDKLKRMTFGQITTAMQKEGIEYHQYCRMD